MTTLVMLENAVDDPSPAAAAAAADYLTYTAYEPVIADAGSDTVTGSSATVDSAVFIGELDGCTIDVKVGGTTVATITDDKDFTQFTEATGAVTYVINNATGSSQTPKIQVLNVGLAYSIPAQEIGFTDPRLSRDTQLATNMGESGVFLGRSVRRSESKFTITANRMALAAAHGDWLTLVQHAEIKPFVFHQATGDITESWWVWADKSMPAATYSDCSEITHKIDVRGFEL